MAGDYGCYCPVARVPFDEVIAIVSRGIAFARDNQIRKLLVDTTNLSGFAPPSAWERFKFAEQAVHSAGESLTIAVLVRPEMMDPEKFGVTVARNRGLLANSFTSEAEALAWLGV